MKITLRDLCVVIDGQSLLDQVNLDIQPGTLTAVVGPNGAGKSTLLRTLYGRVRPSRGTIQIGDHDLADLRPRQAARLRAVVPQHHGLAVAQTAAEVVLTGRYSHSGARPRVQDRQVAQRALERVGGDHLSRRMFRTLSGGERQRVLIARALSQEAPVILLDEPTNHLDPQASHDVLGLLRTLDGTRIVVLHDLNHALTHADSVVVLAGGRVEIHGAPHRALSRETLAAVFDVRSQVIQNPLTGSPHLVTAAQSPLDDERPLR